MLKILVRTLKRNQSVLFSLDLVLDTSVSVTVVCYEVELRWNIKKLLELIQRCMEILPAYYVTHTHTHTHTLAHQLKQMESQVTERRQIKIKAPKRSQSIASRFHCLFSQGGRLVVDRGTILIGKLFPIEEKKHSNSFFV